MRLAIFLALVAWLVPGMAATEVQFATIKQLGELNGVALHCQALPETQRMKRALVQRLPKRRQLGELFDRQSNDSFMRFIKQESRCPSMAELHIEVDRAIEELKSVFSGE